MMSPEPLVMVRGTVVILLPILCYYTADIEVFTPSTESPQSLLLLQNRTE